MKEIAESFASERCPCGSAKAKLRPFCDECWRNLHGLQRAFLSVDAFSQEWERAYRAASNTLRQARRIRS